jgi:endonuclease III
MKTKKTDLALRRLKKRYTTGGALELPTAYQSLVGVLLSARTRDEQVLKLLPGFFKAFPTVQKLNKATVLQIQSKINTIGMFRQKAKNLKALAARVVEEFEGIIPDTMEDLVSLPGVGRKTASVVLPYAFDKPAIAVDVHVHRTANRLGWVKTKTPDKTEQELLKLFKENDHPDVNRVFVKLGRYICISQKPRCWACPLADICVYKEKNLEAPRNAEAILEDVDRREEALQELRKAIK